MGSQRRHGRGTHRSPVLPFCEGGFALLSQNFKDRSRYVAGFGSPALLVRIRAMDAQIIFRVMQSRRVQIVGRDSSRGGSSRRTQFPSQI